MRFRLHKQLAESVSPMNQVTRTVCLQRHCSMRHDLHCRAYLLNKMVALFMRKQVVVPAPSTVASATSTFAPNGVQQEHSARGLHKDSRTPAQLLDPYLSPLHWCLSWRSGTDTTLNFSSAGQVHVETRWRSHAYDTAHCWPKPNQRGALSQSTHSISTEQWCVLFAPAYQPVSASE